MYLGRGKAYSQLCAYMHQHGKSSLSTRQVRRILQITDRDVEVDHIVPQILGGAHHPLNYCLVPAWQNRQWGPYWTAQKAGALGPEVVRHSLAFAQFMRDHGHDPAALAELE